MTSAMLNQVSSCHPALSAIRRKFRHNIQVEGSVTRKMGVAATRNFLNLVNSGLRFLLQ